MCHGLQSQHDEPSKNEKLSATIISTLEHQSASMKHCYCFLALMWLQGYRRYKSMCVCFVPSKEDHVCVNHADTRLPPQVSSCVCFWKHCSEEGTNWKCYLNWCPHVFSCTTSKKSLWKCMKMQHFCIIFLFISIFIL